MKENQAGQQRGAQSQPEQVDMDSAFLEQVNDAKNVTLYQSFCERIGKYPTTKSSLIFNALLNRNAMEKSRRDGDSAALEKASELINSGQGPEDPSILSDMIGKEAYNKNNQNNSKRVTAGNTISNLALVGDVTFTALAMAGMVPAFIGGLAPLGLAMLAITTAITFAVYGIGQLIAHGSALKAENNAKKEFEKDIKHGKTTEQAFNKAYGKLNGFEIGHEPVISAPTQGAPLTPQQQMVIDSQVKAGRMTTRIDPSIVASSPDSTVDAHVSRTDLGKSSVQQKAAGKSVV